MAAEHNCTDKFISRLGYDLKHYTFFAYHLWRAVLNDTRYKYMGKAFPLKPNTLNLLVNDICNSRCQMCYVWKQKRDKEITVDELALILRNPLFSNLSYVGVSGGEPTLRKDLPEIFRVIAQRRSIRGTGIITNAILKENVITKILASAEVCRKAGVPFNVMVSLDGVGEIHDHIRGRKGNFESAVSVIRYFRDKTDIPISIGCTISKNNVWHADDVLDFCRNESVYGRFRIAEFIRRLYNEQQSEIIRNFTELEAYHLGLFFAKLEYTYETSPQIKSTYRSIRKMLMEGAPRSVGCPMLINSVTLDSRGQLIYCAPKSPILGSCLDKSAKELYIKNLDKRKAIEEQYCANCIHDYHAEETIASLWERLKVHFWKWRLSLDGALAKARNSTAAPSAADKTSEPRKFLIVGWYGTETAGDKAILGEIIYRIQKDYPGSSVAVASLYPYITRRTAQELGFSGVEVISTYSVEYWRYIELADEVVMGGGPLMDTESLGFVLRAFIHAKKVGHRTRIAGCGVGPLDKAEKYQKAVQYILRLADTIELRDSASVDWAKSMTGREDIANTGDPAAGYVRRWMELHPKPNPRTFLNLYLREWTTEYQGTLTDKQFEEIKASFERQLGYFVTRLCEQLGLRPRLLPMHHFCIGNDDREFNRFFAKTHLEDMDPIVERAPLTLDEILTSMQEATLSICMRFHSVLFANTLDIPFIAIDYTQGGKTTNYLEDQNRISQMISLKDIADGNWHHLLSCSQRIVYENNPPE